MFGLFGKKSERKRLENEYRKLLSQAHELSRIDRTKSDAKIAEAEIVLKRIDALDKNLNE